MYGVIIGIDIERYSQTERTDEMQSKRNILSKIINDATNAFEIFKKKEIIDAGDGGFILIDTGNYEDVLKAVYKIREEANRNKKIRITTDLSNYYFNTSLERFSNWIFTYGLTSQETIILTF